MSGRFGTASYVHPAEAARRRVKAAKDQQTEQIASQHRKVADYNAKTQRQTANLFTPQIEHEAARRAKVNCDNAGIKDLKVHTAEQAKAVAIVRAGGTLLPQPNIFRKAKTRYGERPAQHVIDREQRDLHRGKL